MSARAGVDVGGTFTDLVSIAADGSLRVRKVASSPADPAQGLFRAVEEIGGGVETVVHGTTVATNALLERRGARVVLVTTAGFEDLLWLRRQDRAALYDLARDHPPPLVSRDCVVGVAERMGSEGVVEPLKPAEVERVVAQVRGLRPEAVAISCLFAFRHPQFEQLLAAGLRAALPGVPVAASHEVLPVFREYERTSTTTAEAYLRPAAGAYLARAEAGLRRRGVSTVRVVTSAGGTLSPPAAGSRAACLALSGPAGGVVGARLAGEAAGVTDLLTLDMGGTSADASIVVGGASLIADSAVVGGVPLGLPAVLIETVSAGGGSVAWTDEGGALRVGPRSAGASPGPACYGRGGTEPTVTDACLVLGWLDPAAPLADEVRLDPGAAERAVATLTPATGRDVTATAAGMVEIATAVMARALKRVSVARGVDPRRMALMPFGGAGGLFGCALADALGMSRVVLPPHPGVLSALGLAAAAERMDFAVSFHRRLEAVTAADIASALQPLVVNAARELPGGVLQRVADCRFRGQGFEIPVPVLDAEPASLREVFITAHRARYGHATADTPIEIVNLRVVATRAPALPDFFGRPGARNGGRAAPRSRAVVVGGARAEATVLPLDTLPAGFVVEGPAVLPGGDATALVEPGWRGTVHQSGALLLERR
ncbi:MAG TPA: hydantoinase/oxoprolinase family protein [Gemmatimonadales bacterium]|nr:hydantoinase/oxoprolinase family protein [Gemmatimonadales bacterium]